ncbi:MAG: OsmC family peroxiredoxin [Anaerolineales bacterium]
MAVRSSNAVWQGTLKEGFGTMRLGSGLFEGPFTHGSRFKEDAGSNPEELIAAAHAGCFSMFLSALLTNNESPPARVDTTATVHLGDGPTITKIELQCKADVPGIDADAFARLAAEAKEKCPVSKALACVEEITLDAKLVG